MLPLGRILLLLVLLFSGLVPLLWLTLFLCASRRLMCSPLLVLLLLQIAAICFRYRSSKSMMTPRILASVFGVTISSLIDIGAMLDWAAILAKCIKGSFYRLESGPTPPFPLGCSIHYSLDAVVICICRRAYNPCCIVVCWSFRPHALSKIEAFRQRFRRVTAPLFCTYISRASNQIRE